MSAGLAVRTYCAASHGADQCGSNGLPLTPNAIRICGRFQRLTALRHPALCVYVAIVRGRHERLYVVAEHHSRSLREALTPEDALISLTTSATEEDLRRYAAQALGALAFLNERGIAHRNIQPDNMLLDGAGNLKLADYGLHYMTNGGAEVDFPIGNPRYIAPELLCLSPVRMAREAAACPRADVWSLGVVLLEQHLGARAWMRFGEDVDAVLSRVRSVWDELGGADKAQSTSRGAPTPGDARNALAFLLREFRSDGAPDMGPELRSFLETCLRVNPLDRPTPAQLLSHPFLAPLAPSCIGGREEPAPWHSNVGAESADDPLVGRSLAEVYHLWTLAGGDVAGEMVRRGLVQSRPPVCHVPALVRLDGAVLGGARDRARLYDSAATPLALDGLRARLQAAALDAARSIAFGSAERVANECGVDRPPAKGAFEPPAQPDSAEATEAHPADVLDAALGGRARVDLREAITSPITSASVAADTDRAANGNFAESTARGEADALLPLAIRERDIEYQLRRIALFRRLLAGYPFTRRKLCAEAAVDIPPFVRGCVWAAILGVPADYREAYAACDKETETPTDRQIDVDIPRCHQYEQLLASPDGHAKFRRILKAWVQANPELAYWQGLDSLCAPFLALNFNDEARAYACLSAFVRRYLPGFFAHDNASTIQDYLASFRHVLAFGDPQLAAHLDKIGFLPELYAIPWFLTMYTHVFPLAKIYHLWDALLLGPPSLPLCIGAAILRQMRDALLAAPFNECILVFADMPDINIERCTRDAFRLSVEIPPSITRRPAHHDGGTDSPPAQSTHGFPGLPLEVLKRELAPRISSEDVGRILHAALILDVRTPDEFRRGHVAGALNAPPGHLKRAGPRLRAHRGNYIAVVGPDDAGPKAAERLVRASYSKVAFLHGGMEAVAREAAWMLCACDCRSWGGLANDSSTPGDSRGAAVPQEDIECVQCRQAPPDIE